MMQINERPFAVVLQKRPRGPKVVFSVHETRADAERVVGQLASHCMVAKVARAKSTDTPGASRKSA